MWVGVCVVDRCFFFAFTHTHTPRDVSFPLDIKYKTFPFFGCLLPLLGRKERLHTVRTDARQSNSLLTFLTNVTLHFPPSVHLRTIRQLGKGTSSCSCCCNRPQIMAWYARLIWEWLNIVCTVCELECVVVVYELVLFWLAPRTVKYLCVNYVCGWCVNWCCLIGSNSKIFI